MNAESEIENDTFAAAVAEGITADSKPAVVEKPAQQVEKPVEKPEKPVVAEKSTKPEEKTELENPNLSTAEVKKEPTEADQDIKPAGMKEATWIDFKKVRTERNDAQKERDAMKVEVETLKKQVAEQGKSTKEIDDLKKELQATKEQLTGYESEITVTRVEATPKFKSQVTAPMSEITTAAEEIAKRYEIPPKTLMAAIQETDPAKAADLLEEATAEFKNVDRTEVVQMARDYRRVQKTAEDLRKNAGQQLEAMTREQQQAQERASTKTIEDYRKAAKEQFAAFQERIPQIRNVEGKDQWNAHLANKLKNVEAVNVNDLEVGEVAKMKVAFEVLPEVVSALNYISKQRDDLQTKLDAAETRLAKFKKTEPAAGGGGNGNASGGRRDAYVSFEDAAMAEVQ